MLIFVLMCVLLYMRVEQLAEHFLPRANRLARQNAVVIEYLQVQRAGVFALAYSIHKCLKCAGANDGDVQATFGRQFDSLLLKQIFVAEVTSNNQKRKYR
ncbi:hypothetical protein IPG36_06475 [bacterium]|nr:MAG: hypothetical protein IPG36_06475 [bacterium]